MRLFPFAIALLLLAAGCGQIHPIPNQERPEICMDTGPAGNQQRCYY